MELGWGLVEERRSLVEVEPGLVEESFGLVEIKRLLVEGSEFLVEFTLAHKTAGVYFLWKCDKLYVYLHHPAKQLYTNS